MKRIPVYEPLFQGNEKKYLQDCIDSGWVSSDGYYVRKFEEEFAKWSGNKYAVAVCNGTAALETAIWSLNIHDMVCVPTSTIISCASAVLKNNLDLDFYNNHLKCCFNEHLMRCHLFGKWYEAGKIESCSLVIDDASQYWKPFKVKDIACYSLYANKLITSGEGGVIVTNNENYYKRAINFRNLCHSSERFIHNECGYNYRMSNLQAAVALAQLEQINIFVEIKQINRDLYKKYLPNTCDILFDVEIPWMYLIHTKIPADCIVMALEARGIDCRRYFYPLHKQPCFNRKYEHLKFPQADNARNYWFYLPSGLTLTEDDIQYVCKYLEECL